MKIQNKTQQLTVLAMFAAIILILGIPGNPIGFIPLPFIRGTTIHIPVIIGALILGPKYGAVLGFMFGLVSLANNTFNPTVTSFVFSPFYSLPGEESGSWLALIIVFVPRILVGVIPWFVWAGLKKLLPKKLELVSWAAAGVAGAATNTLLVMHGIFLFFGETWWRARTPAEDIAYYTSELGEVASGVIYSVITGIIAVNGVPEAIGAGIIVTAVMAALTVVVKVRKV